MTRRPAVTLIEALMAIFVMAIGLLALLTLFPLGAVQMAQALRDQRATETSNQAVAMYKALQLGNDPVVSPTTGGLMSVASPITPGTPVQPGQLSVFQNPWPGVPAALGPPPPILSGPGYPLYVDPYFAASVGPLYFTQTTQQAVGFPAPGYTPPPYIFGIKRSTVSNPLLSNVINPGAFPNSAPRWCTLQDDITFTDNGLPGDVGSPLFNSNVVQREGRYSFAFMLRRANASNADLPLDLTVVVYSGRQPGLDLSGNPIGETPYDAVFLSDRVVQVLVTGTSIPPKPALRRGSWILDARINLGPGVPPQGYFYRVTNVTDLGPNGLEVEVQAPGGAQGPGGVTIVGPCPGPNIPFLKAVVVMDNVIEVFQKGTNY
jgi:hypothetical protein